MSEFDHQLRSTFFGGNIKPPSPSITTAVGFDRAKWNALVQYDKDIAAIAERLSPLGQEWVDEFASSYLALNDKQYLPAIEQKIVAAAKVSAEKGAQARIDKENRQKAHLQEKERLAQERKRQLRVVGPVLVLIAVVGIGAYYQIGHQQEEARLKIEADVKIRAALNKSTTRDNDWAAVDQALSQGGNPNLDLFGVGTTPLFFAISGRDSDAVAMLLKHGADMHIPDRFGGTALAIVVDSNPPNDPNMVAIAKLLLEHGADVNARYTSGPYSGLTLLDIAPPNSYEIIKLLTEHGARKTKLEDRPAVAPEFDPRCHWEGLKRVCPDNKQ